jgi:hypothetical protein
MKNLLKISVCALMNHYTAWEPVKSRAELSILPDNFSQVPTRFRCGQHSAVSRSESIFPRVRLIPSKNL